MMPSTTEALLDVNVLIASVFEDHAHYMRATAFVRSLDHFYTSPTTQGGFLRFASRPWKNAEAIEQPPRLTIATAHTKLKELVASTGHAFLPDDASFSDLPLQSISGHKQWTDAYLLTLARRHNLRLASFDSRMSNMDVLSKPVLFVVP